MNAKELREEMAARVGADVLKVVRTKMGGGPYDSPVFRACWSYFYSHGQTSEAKAKHVEQTIQGAEVLAHGDHWHSFVGGAKPGSARDSFFWVDFRIKA